jgi:2-oxoglutarate dehydrogenase E2 component (dihydrolipoamide succinyltransferase)
MAVDIKVPALGESVTEATVARWLKKQGEGVKADEALCELETDKVTLEVFAPQAGVLNEVLAQAGATVGVGATLGRIDPQGMASAPQPRSASAAPTAQPAPAAVASLPAQAESQPTGQAPSVRRIAAEQNIDPATIAGTGRDGRVTKADMLSASKPAMAQPPAPPQPVARPAAPPAPPRALKEREERVSMSRLRQRIAQRLKEAQNTAAILTTFNEVDMSAVMALRDRYKDGFEKKHKVKLGFMSFFVRAALQALKELPAVNAEINGTDIIYKNYYDIGVAVGTESGLVVPVVRDADTLSFAAIEAKINELGKRAREGKLALDELQGGTFTISNGGVYGSLMSTPILNPPQSGILGMHKIQQRPMAVDGKVEIRPMMYLALSYDHRIVDGREAVTFLVRIKECLEDPQRLLLEL